MHRSACRSVAALVSWPFKPPQKGGVGPKHQLSGFYHLTLLLDLIFTAAPPKSWTMTEVCVWLCFVKKNLLHLSRFLQILVWLVFFYFCALIQCSSLFQLPLLLICFAFVSMFHLLEFIFSLVVVQTLSSCRSRDFPKKTPPTSRSYFETTPTSCPVDALLLPFLAPLFLLFSHTVSDVSSGQKRTTVASSSKWCCVPGSMKKSGFLHFCKQSTKKCFNCMDFNYCSFRTIGRTRL